MSDLKSRAKEIRLELIELHHRTRSAHIGSELSCVDILVALYWKVMKPSDQFILSKSHAAIGLYVVMNRKGIIDKEVYDSFHKEGSLLAEHITYPESAFKGGSLGHGLAYAVGMAYAKKLDREEGKIYCMIGDGELQEGSTLEAMRLASRFRLDNLCVIIDNNSFGAYQRIENSEIENLLNSMHSNWCVQRIDGNDVDAVVGALEKEHNKLPVCIAAKTIMAKGIKSMEDQQRAHYESPTDEELKQGVQ